MRPSRRGALATTVALVVALAGTFADASAQAGGAAAGYLIQSYRFDDAQAAGLADFRLITSPFALVLPVGRLAGLEIMGTWAEGRATGPEGAEAVLTGLTDTRASLSLNLVPDYVVLRAEAVMPSGQSTLSLEEAAVAGVVATEFLPFGIAGWGSGGSVGGDLALALQAGPVGLGLAGGYQAARSFEPLTDQTFAYRPGDQIRVRLAVDGDVGESGTLSLVLGLQRYNEDRIGGANLFRSGNRLEGLVSYAFALGLRGSGQVFAGAFHRAHGSVLVEDPELAGATDSPSQDLFTGGFNFRLPVGGRSVLFPDAEVRMIRTADGVGQGWMGSAGAALDLRVAGTRYGSRVVFGPSARVRFGRIVVRDGAESTFSGWEAGLTVRLETGR